MQAHNRQLRIRTARWSAQNLHKCPAALPQSPGGGLERDEHLADRGQRPSLEPGLAGTRERAAAESRAIPGRPGGGDGVDDQPNRFDLLSGACEGGLELLEISRIGPERERPVRRQEIEV